MRTNRGVDSSLLVKPPAIAIWLVLCIVAILYEKTAFGVFTGFVFVLTLSSYMWARASLGSVDFDLMIDRIGMFPGQAFTVTRLIRNNKTLPMLWTEIREPCTLTDCAAPNADVIVENEIVSDRDEEPEKVYERLYTVSLVKWKQSVHFKDEWHAMRRGIMEIEASLLRSGDGFGLCAEGKRFAFPSPRRIVVYPQLARASAADILNDMWDTRSETDGYLKDRTVIKSVRDYLPGDAARDVNMRLLARGQTLKTNVFETVTPDTVLFVLDTGSFRNSDPDIFERALSVVAALIDELTKRGIQAALMTPASKWAPETCTSPSAHERDRYRMFELLAAASAQDAYFTAEVPLPADEPGRIYIVCAGPGRLTLPPGGFPFPEHKTLLLAAEGTDGGSYALPVRNLFDFERGA